MISINENDVPKVECKNVSRAYLNFKCNASLEINIDMYSILIIQDRNFYHI
jgi:hypothetical protein